MKHQHLLSLLCILLSLIFIIGCVGENNKEYVSGSLGTIQVKGNIENIDIIDYEISSKIYNESSSISENVENFIFTKNTIYYQIKGNLINNGNIQYDSVNISIKFFRDEFKGIYYFTEKYYIKYNVDPGESWQYTIDYSKIDEKFGPVESIEFEIKTS